MVGILLERIDTAKGQQIAFTRCFNATTCLLKWRADQGCYFVIFAFYYRIESIITADDALYSREICWMSTDVYREIFK